MTAATVELLQVSKHYGVVHALQEVSLRIEPGEIVAILGPNGAGKSTAVSLLLGLRRPTAGTVRVFGFDPRQPAGRLRIGAMLQEPDAPGSLRVQELIELFRRLYPRALPLRQVLETAHLNELAHRYPAHLSGGQRQRLSFALAICGDPDALFLDEPSAGLDAETRQALWAQIRQFSQAGKTVVLTTHNFGEADALASRIVVIDRGRIIAEGSPEQIKARVGGTHIRFRWPSLRPELLRNLIGVERLTVVGDRVDVYTRQPETVLRAVFRNDWCIHDTEVMGAGLEEAFLELTTDRSPPDDHR